MTTGRGSWVLEESKCHSCLQEGQKGGPMELQASQPGFSSWGGDGAANPRNFPGT